MTSNQQSSILQNLLQTNAIVPHNDNVNYTQNTVPCCQHPTNTQQLQPIPTSPPAPQLQLQVLSPNSRPVDSAFPPQTVGGIQQGVSAHQISGIQQGVSAHQVSSPVCVLPDNVCAFIHGQALVNIKYLCSIKEQYGINFQIDELARYVGEDTLILPAKGML